MKTHPLLSRRSPEDKVTGTFDRLFTGTAFELQLPNRPSRLLGHAPEVARRTFPSSGVVR